MTQTSDFAASAGIYVWTRSLHLPKSHSLPGKLSLFGRLTAGSDGFTLTNEAWWKVWQGCGNWVCCLPGRAFPSIYIHIKAVKPFPRELPGLFLEMGCGRKFKSRNSSKSSQDQESNCKLWPVFPGTSSSLPKPTISGKDCDQISKYIFLWCFNLIVGETGYCFIPTGVGS